MVAMIWSPNPALCTGCITARGTLSDLSRNALTSVFLRTMEHYDGILILTSNQVGTFNEAFKSRIRLNLYYDSPTFSQNQQI